MPSQYWCRCSCWRRGRGTMVDSSHDSRPRQGHDGSAKIRPGTIPGKPAPRAGYIGPAAAPHARVR
ncbi:hypothetical protein C8T65DRAFT_295832 [Cerioporus squamosus]|nr:hypothetical protein C8T65DRAFT_295832 [Cerioporus squamosus]